MGLLWSKEKNGSKSSFLMKVGKKMSANFSFAGKLPHIDFFQIHARMAKFSAAMVFALVRDWSVMAVRIALMVEMN